MSRKIQKLTVDLSQIPCPFDMREHAERVETGPVQFNDDWPGVFIRGDNAAWMAINLSEAIRILEPQVNGFNNVTMISTLKGLLHLLQGSHISNVVNDDDTDVGC